MNWREKLIWVVLVLVLIAWGLVIFDVRSVLMAHLTKYNWLMIAFIYPGAFLALIAAYRSAPQGTRVRGQVPIAIVSVIISWAVAFALMGRIGR